MPSVTDLLPAIEDKAGVKGTFGGELEFVPRIPTGIFELDLGLGGGVPCGRITEIFGPEGSGKTNLALAVIREAQRVDPTKKQAFIDVEGTWDPSWAAILGVDVTRVYVIRPDFAEQVSDVMQQLILADDLNCVVLDSIAAMAPKGEVVEDSDQQFYGGATKQIKRMTQKVQIELNRRRNAKLPAPAVIWINQVRANFDAGKYGNPEKTPGGYSPRFAYSLRLRTYSSPVFDKAVSKTLPVLRETSVVVKKYKVPVTALNMAFKLVLLPFKDLKPGETDSWHTVERLLKAKGELKQNKKGWEYEGETLPVLKAWRERYRTDYAFRMKLQTSIINDAVSANGFVEEDSFDLETGELTP